FIVRMAHGEESPSGVKRWGRGDVDIAEPMPTVTASNEFALVTPYLTEHANASNPRVFPADEPLRTQVAQVKGGHFAVVTPFLAGVGGRAGQSPERTLEAPYHTTTAK